MPSTPLQLSAAQSAILTLLNQPGTNPGTAPLGAAISQGVVDNHSAPLLAALIPTWTTLTPAEQQTALSSLTVGLAAFMSVLGLPTAVGLTVTIPLAPLTTVRGSLTFTNGILTAATPPA